MGPVLSAKAYVSVLNPAPLATGVVPLRLVGLPPVPLRLVGLPPVPVAVKVNDPVAAVPPLSLVTLSTRVNDGALSSLLIVHVTAVPGGTTTCVASLIVAVPQFQALAVYPEGPF